LFIIMHHHHTGDTECPVILRHKPKVSDAMKNIRHFRKGDAVDNRLEMTNHQEKVPQSKLLSGSITNKFPVVLDDGRTVVFIADKSREREIRLRYALRKGL